MAATFGVPEALPDARRRARLAHQHARGCALDDRISRLHHASEHDAACKWEGGPFISFFVHNCQLP